MRFKRLLFVSICLLFLPSLSSGQEPEGRSIGADSDLRPRFDMNWTRVSALVTESAQERDAAAWRAEVERVRAKRERNRKLTWLALGVSGVAPLVSIGSPNAMIASTIGGGGFLIYTLFAGSQINSELEELAYEGQKRGYVTVSPTRGGMQASIGFSF